MSVSCPFPQNELTMAGNGKTAWFHAFGHYTNPESLTDDYSRRMENIKETLATQHRSNLMIEERHTDQLDYNLAVDVSHQIRNNMRIVGGANLRINRTWYYDEVKDLLGGDYWYDVDKFAERDMSQSALNYQNDLDYYLKTGHARVARVGDKISYNYRAHLLESNAWAVYTYGVGGFSMNVAGKVGYSTMHREGLWRKGLFPNNSLGDSKKLDYLVYSGKLNLSYRFSAPIRSKRASFTCRTRPSSPMPSSRPVRATRPRRAFRPSRFSVPI